MTEHVSRIVLSHPCGVAPPSLDVEIEGVARRLLDADGAAGDGFDPAVRATRALARLIRRPGRGPVSLARVLSRACTLAAIGCDEPMEMMTSVIDLAADRGLAQGLAAAVVELVRAVRCAAGPDGATIYVAADWDGSHLTLAVASPEAGRSPALDARGAASFAAAFRLVACMGGDLVRGVGDGRMLFGAAFPWRATAAWRP